MWLRPVLLESAEAVSQHTEKLTPGRKCTWHTKLLHSARSCLRLSPPGTKGSQQATSFDVIYGGGEANVAVSLANYVCDAHFVFIFPSHEIGQCAVNALRALGVHTEYVARGGDRLGIYYCESGASQRTKKKIYEREKS